MDTAGDSASSSMTNEDLYRGICQAIQASEERIIKCMTTSTVCVKNYIYADEPVKSEDKGAAVIQKFWKQYRDSLPEVMIRSYLTDARPEYKLKFSQRTSILDLLVQISKTIGVNSATVKLVLKGKTADTYRRVGEYQILLQDAHFDLLMKPSLHGGGFSSV
jgi:hypothetical protein